MRSFDRRLALAAAHLQRLAPREPIPLVRYATAAPAPFRPGGDLATFERSERGSGLVFVVVPPAGAAAP